MEKIVIYYKKLSGKLSEGFILSIKWNRRTMTEIMIPVIGLIGLILQNLLR